MFAVSKAFARRIHSSAVLRKEAAAAINTNELTLNFSSPSASIAAGREVKRVTVPGRDGVFGISKNVPGTVAELQPGLVKIENADNTVEEAFIVGGFAFKHPNNVLDVSTPELAKLEHIDVDALKAAHAEATRKVAGAAAGSKEAAEAKISLEVYNALGKALKVTL